MLHGAACAVGFRIQTDLNIEDSEDPQQFYNTALFAQLSSSSVCSAACLHAFGCVLSVFFLSVHSQRLVHSGCQNCVGHSASVANDGWW